MMMKAFRIWFGLISFVIAIDLSALLLSAQDLIVEPCQLHFTATADSPLLPPSQTINFKSFSGASLPYQSFGASMVLNLKRIDAPLRIFPGSGITPGSALVTIDHFALSRFGPSDYIYTLLFATVPSPPPYTFCTAQVTILPAPKPVVTSVLNAATFQQGAIAPGEIVTILGTNIAPMYDFTTLVQIFPGFTTYNLPFGSGGAKVTFNGLLAPILYAVRTCRGIHSGSDCGSVSPAVRTDDRSRSHCVTWNLVAIAEWKWTRRHSEYGLLSDKRGSSSEARKLYSDHRNRSGFVRSTIP
jgi:hypothetical protein